MKTNFLITGKRQIGKSSLIKQVLEHFDIKACGFVTLAKYDDKGQRMGFYYHSLLPVFNCQNDLDIMVGMTPIFETFETLGKECLKNTLECDNRFVILDEVGRIEKNNICYISLLNGILDSKKIVFASLKKENIPFIEEIKSRSDSYLFDLDEMDFEFVKNKIIKIMEEIIYEKNI